MMGHWTCSLYLLSLLLFSLRWAQDNTDTLVLGTVSSLLTAPSLCAPGGREATSSKYSPLCWWCWLEVSSFNLVEMKKEHSTVTFGRFPRTGDQYICSAHAPCNAASWRRRGLPDASRSVCLPLEPTSRTSTSKWKGWRGCNIVA